MSISKIKSANIVWYSKIIQETNFEALDIPNSIIYPNLSKNLYWIAISDKNTKFMDQAYQNDIDFNKFHKILSDAILFEGELLKTHKGSRILIKNRFAQFLDLVEKSRVATLDDFIKSKGILYDQSKLLALSKNKDYFLLLSVCKCCGMPEDESDFIWIAFDDGMWWVRMWIHNNGNMWTAQFKL